MKKYLLIAYHFNEYMYELFSSLNNLNSNTKLLIITNKNIPDNFKSLNIIKFSKPRIREVSKNIFLLKKIKKEIVNYNPSTIHFQGCNPWFNLLLNKLYKNYNMVHTLHDVQTHIGEKKMWFTISQKNMSKHSHKIIVHGEFLKQQLVETHKWIKPNRVFAIPHGPLSTYAKLNPKKYKEKQNHILFFGRIYKYKGLDYLIKAESLISKEISNFKIVIAGRGEDFSKYEKLMNDKSNYIVMNNYIPDEDIPKIFQESSVVVLPYIDASQSGVVPIAYEFKKPVIVTDVGSISEVVDTNKTGYVIESKNVEELAKKIIFLLKHSELRKMFGDNGYKKLTTELNWDTIAKQTIAAYNAK